MLVLHRGDFWTPTPTEGSNSCNRHTLGAGFLACLFVACVMCVPARAADMCLTLPQARAVHPNVYLVYRLDGGRRCWSPPTPAQRTVRHRGSANTSTGAGAASTTLWPALASAVIVVDAALFTTEPATRWPLLLDIDEVTADDPLANDLTGRRSTSRHSANGGRRCLQTGLH